MTRSERDLVLTLRAELAGIDPSRSCDRVAEAAGLGSSAVRREGPVARLAVRLRRGAEGAARTAAVPAGDAAATPAAPVVSPVAFDWDHAADHCRTAWLRGRFLACGSLSLSGGRTHLEFVVDPAEAPVLAGRLADIDLPASWRIRRGRGVVTWKSGEAVGTFLRRIGAAGGLLELEARQVSRALRGDLNRVLNAESANLQRAVSAAGRQLDAIAILEADGRLARQPEAVRMVAGARRETPEATLSELAERLQFHRSAVQRALERIEHLAVHDDEAVERPTRRRRSAALA
jgi:WhiA C-terminal HTH domain/WhiA LAGLIDADG-like domain